MLSLKLWIGLSQHGPGFAAPETELPEQPLALPDTELDSKAVTGKCRKRLAVPQRTRKANVPWFLAQRSANRIDLRGCQAPWPARALALHQAGKTFAFKPVDPILHRTRRIAQQSRHLWALHPLGHQEHGMQPMVVARFLGPPNLILQSKHDCRSIGNAQRFHASMTSQQIPMRKYL
jgi:hypothetical protein